MKIFLLGGQSNMEGADKGVNLPPSYRTPFAKVKIWQDKTRTWQPIAPKPQEGFGPEVSFGRAISEVLPDVDVRLIKYAQSNTALYNDWDPKTKGPQYVAFTNTVQAALADLDASSVTYEIAGMLWLQGESDAIEMKAEAYEENLKAFIADMRARFKTPAMPFIIARVLAYYGSKTGQAKIVRDAQVKVAEEDPNVGWFDTDDCAIISAGHYNAASLIEIGKRYAAAYKAIATKAT